MCNKHLSNIVPFVAILTMVAFCDVVQARPGYGGNADSCKGCHGSGGQSNRPGALEVTGEGLLNLDDLNGTNSDRGDLQFFSVEPGGSIDLTMNVLDGTDVYAVQIKRFGEAGVLDPAGSNFLTGYADDSASTWYALEPASGPADTFFTNIPGFGTGTAWTGEPDDPYAFTLTLDANTQVDTYDLQYAVAGRTDGYVNFYEDQHFYVVVSEAIPEPSTLVLLGMASLGLCCLKRRR